MAKVIKTKTGKSIRLLNPAEKGKRYANQLKTGRVKETGEKLSDTQLSWRSGYMQARQDSADCYNATHKKQVTNKRNKNSRS